MIADFGHAQWVDDSKPQINPIQNDYYRASEVILSTGWGYSADIWNLGLLDGAITTILRLSIC